ncbi:hypothetical protein PVL29_018611 [Vitis rotundifolia]|uniref:Alkane hydroxylase MAH1-like n=1 Tax=Vitis rotundifolia TaxID=103349 RepID=A0AA38Z5M2_VITRO|nr:hypothetical protein PVL29_018611 [Vitis rotundifolia]
MSPTILFQYDQVLDLGAEILERCGGTFLVIRQSLWFAHSDMLVTCIPADAHHVMSTNFWNFPKGPEFRMMLDAFGNGLFISDLEDWSFHQRIVDISLDKVENGLVPVLEHASQQRLAVDFQDLFQRFGLDATCALITGCNPKSICLELPDVPFASAMEEAGKVIFLCHVYPKCIWKLQRWLGIGSERILIAAKKTLYDFAAERVSFMRERSNMGTNQTEEGLDILSAYINEDEAFQSSASNKVLIDNILSLLLAGKDTTSAAFSWFFWLVSKNPSVETKIIEELKAVVPAKETEKWHLFDAEELSKLVYLHGALCESLRLFPPNILPSGHRLDPSTKVIFHAYAMGRMACVWGKDCLEFKPERWVTGKGRTKHEPAYKFLSFSAGPRICLGKEVVFLQMKVVVAAIMHNYHFQMVEGHRVVPTVSTVLHMKHGLKVNVKNKWA